MEYVQKNGDVIIFKNENKEGKQPDYNGNLTTPDGVKYSVSLWVNESQKTGKKYLGGKIQEPYNPNGNTTDTVVKKVVIEQDNDLPF